MIATFEWNGYFETGLADVDAQHRHLVDLLNLLGSSLSGVLAVGLGIYAGKLIAGWTEWAAMAFSKFWQAWTQLG